MAERLVLLSAQEYRRLKAQDRASLYPWELGEDALAALAASEPPAEAEAFDHELRFVRSEVRSVRP